MKKEEMRNAKLRIPTRQ